MVSPLVWLVLAVLVRAQGDPVRVRVENDEGTDVTNNLISDLTPLLALFGEQFAKQFMSESISHWDCLIFALAPLGIITAIVGAIRVGGPSWLKALVGRARETFATAEMDSMSCTSNEVCELWNGRAIVRIMGSPKIVEILFFKDEYKMQEAAQDVASDRTFGLHTLRTTKRLVARGTKSSRSHSWSDQLFQLVGRSKVPDEESCIPDTKGETTVVQKQVLEPVPDAAPPGTDRKPSIIHNGTPRSPMHARTHSQSSKIAKLMRAPTAQQKAKPYPPNLSLNVSPDKRHRNIEKYLAVLFGIAVQGVVLIISGLISYYGPYHRRYLRSGQPVDPYAFPVFCAGTLALAFGMFLCTSVVEQGSEENYLEYLGAEKQPPSELPQLPPELIDEIVPLAQTKTRSNTNGAAPRDSKPTLSSSGDEARPESIRVLWLQGSKTVNDHSFDSYAIIGHGTRDAIKTSNRAILIEEPKSNVAQLSDPHLQHVKTELGWKLQTYAISGALISLSGFVLQFMGLRGLNFVVSVLQLVAIVSMTAVRAILRRGLTKHPHSEGLIESYEIDWLATQFTREGKPEMLWAEDVRQKVTEGSAQLMAEVPQTPDGPPRRPGLIRVWSSFRLLGQPRRKSTTDINATGLRGRMWTVNPATEVWHHKGRWDGEAQASAAESAQRVVEVRKRLAKLTNWTGPATEPAVSVAKAIQVVMNELCKHEPLSKNKFTWSIRATWNGSPDYISLVANRKTEGSTHWRADSAELEAVISLWLYSVHPDATKDEDETEEPADTDEGYEVKLGQHRRILCVNSPAACQVLKWWIGDERGDMISEMNCTPQQPIKGARAVIGFEDPENGGSVPRSDASHLGTTTKIPLPQLFAQHLFSAFMWAVAPYVEPIEADKMSADEPQLKVQNRKLNDLVRTIVQRTKLGTFEETFMCMIPALRHHKKLFEADCMIEHARGRVERQLASKNWREARKTYSELLDNGLKFGDDSPLAVKTTMVMVEFFRYIRTAASLAQRQGHELPDSEHLIDEIKVEIMKGNPEIVRELAKRYHQLGMLGKCPAFRPLKTGEDQSSEQSDDRGLQLLGSVLGRNSYHEELVGPRDRRGALRLNKVTGDTEEEKALAGKPDYIARTPLHYAVLEENIEMVERLLKLGAPIDARDYIQCTALHYAARLKPSTESTKIIKMLLDNGSSVDAQDMYGKTPLHHAAEYTRPIDPKAENTAHDCDDDASDDSHSIDVERLHKRREESVAALNIDLLLKRGADKTIKDQLGMLPIHIGAQRGTKYIIEPLLGYHRDATDRSGKTALHWAAGYGNAGILQVLIRCKVLTDIKDELGRTALHLAALNGHHSAVGELLKHGCKSSERDDEDRLPGHLAARCGYHRVVKKLLESSVDLNSQDCKGRTMLHLAAIHNHVSVIRCLREFQERKASSAREADSTADSTALNRPESENTRDKDQQEGTGIVGQAKAKKAEGTSSRRVDKSYLELKDTEGMTALHLAVIRGKRDAVYELLDSGASTLAKDGCSNTILHLASAHGIHEIIARLLLEDVSSSSKNETGQTPLHVCFTKSTTIDPVPVIRVLLGEPRGIVPMDVPLPPPKNSKAEAARITETVNTGDGNGNTALHLAASRRLHHAVEILLNKGANIRARNKNEETPLHICFSRSDLRASSDAATDPEALETTQKLLNWPTGPIVELDAIDAHGSTVLHAAANAARELLPATEALLLKGANANTTNYSGERPFTLAMEKGHIEIARVLAKLTRKSDPYYGSPLLTATVAGNVDLIEKLLGSGEDPFRTDAHGWSAILCAFQSKSGPIRAAFEKAYNLCERPHPDKHMPKPTAWSPEHNHPCIELTEEGLLATGYSPKDKGLPKDESYYPVTQADHPLVSNLSDGSSYFEVEVRFVSGIAEIGLSRGMAPLDAIIGWGRQQHPWWGYHCDDGRVFHARKSQVDVGSWHTGDVVGCGVTKEGLLFFTKNGKRKDTEIINMMGPLFPIIGMGPGTALKAKFGPEFMYEVETEEPPHEASASLAASVADSSRPQSMQSSERRRRIPIYSDIVSPRSPRP